jgi:hypothetical protein
MLTYDYTEAYKALEYLEMVHYTTMYDGLIRVTNIRPAKPCKSPNSLYMLYCINLYTSEM